MGLVEVRDSTSALRRPLAPPTVQGPSAVGSGRDLPPQPHRPRPVGLACQKDNLSAAGFPPGIIASFQAARADSTRPLYGSKWGVFEDWCQEQSTPVVSFQASNKDVLVFLQGRLDLGNTFSIIKVYLAAISACLLGFDGESAGRQPLVIEFLRGAQRASGVPRSPFPKWEELWFSTHFLAHLLNRWITWISSSSRSGRSSL